MSIGRWLFWGWEVAEVGGWGLVPKLCHYRHPIPSDALGKQTECFYSSGQCEVIEKTGPQCERRSEWRVLGLGKAVTGGVVAARPPALLGHLSVPSTVAGTSEREKILDE